ncbi:CcmD family protein [Natronospora cellulosivora (SeqCode)]
MDYLNYLLIAYLLIWTLIFAYTLKIESKQKKIEKEIKFLRKVLEKK